jgi:hypothetical protein
MRIDMAHLQAQGISFALFAADANNRTNGARQVLLGQLVAKARRSGLRVDKATLAFQESGRTTFFGTPDLVKYLSSRGGVSTWTHTLDV